MRPATTIEARPRRRAALVAMILFLGVTVPRGRALDRDDALKEARELLDARRVEAAEPLLRDLLERCADENRRRGTHPDAGSFASEVLRELSRVEERRGDLDAAEDMLLRAGRGWRDIRAYTDFSRIHAWVLGRFYLRAGRCKKAEPLFRELLEPLEKPSSTPQREHDRRWDEIVVADRRADLAAALHCLGRRQEALHLLEQARKTYLQGIGWGYLRGTGLGDVLDAAVREVELSLELDLTRDAGRLTADWLPVVREQLGEESREYEEWLLLRARALEARGAGGVRSLEGGGPPTDAAALRARAEELRQQRLGLDRPDAGTDGSWLSAGKEEGEAAFDEAVRKALELSEGDNPAPAFGPLPRALALGKRLVPPDDPRMAKLRVRLCKVLTLRHDFEVAHRHCAWALDHVEADQEPAWRIETLASSALLLSLQDRRDRAIPFRVEEAELLEELHGPRDRRTLDALQTVAHDLGVRREQYGERGKDAWLEVIHRRRARPGASRDLQLLSARQDLVEAFGDDPALEPHARDALVQAVEMWGVGSWWHAETLRTLGLFLLRQDRAREALPYLEEGLRHARTAARGRVPFHEQAVRRCRSRLRRDRR